MKTKYTLAALAVATLAANAATTIATYNYATSGNPTTQGWNQNGGSGTWNTPYDNGSGWEINDGSSSLLTWYDQSFDGSTVDGGWTATMTLTPKSDLRKDDASLLVNWHDDNDNNDGNSIWMENATQGYTYIARLFIDANDDLYLNDTSTNTLVASNFGYDTETTLTITYSGGVATANIEGSDVVMTSFGAGATDRVIFGHWGGSYMGSAQYNSFQLVAVPEPSSAALLGLGSLALILRRRK